MLNKHYKHQEKFFNGRFSKKREYKLVPWNKSYIQRIKNHMLKKDFKGKTLLDIGAGDGYVTIEMAKMGLKVIALDLSQTALDNISRYKVQFNLPNITLIHGSAEEIPIKNNSVDYIVANAILEHLPNEAESIFEWKRVLKKGGRIIIVVPLSYKYLWPFFWLPNYIHDKKFGHLRRYSLESIKNKFQMKEITHLYTGHLLKTLWVILTLISGSEMFDEKLEIIDNKKGDQRYGASNIAVILEK